MSPVDFSVFSETDHLRQVIVHTPGLEMDLVSPMDREALLFEDILYLSHARKEHELMCSVFEKVVGPQGAVFQITDLLKEAFKQDDARASFVDQLVEASPGVNLSAFEKDLNELSPDELFHFALTGQSPLSIEAKPLPNLMFMRDLAAVVGNHMVLSHAATSARSRESVIINVVASYHPAFSAHRDRIIKLPRGITFEGGDLLVASEDTVIIGNSERTSFGGAISVARRLFSDTSIKNVIMVHLPNERSWMHLDTVFTFASPDECVVYPPLINLKGLNNVLTFTAGDGPDHLHSTIHSDLKQALEAALNRSLTFVPCGGSNPLSQQREQWTDGANYFAIAPGVIIGYERNQRTFEEMAALGYRVVTAEGFLSYYKESSWTPGDKIAIKLDGYELSRGRGGPRCMTMPVARVRP
jgi:arginine deiminase